MRYRSGTPFIGCSVGSCFFPGAFHVLLAVGCRTLSIGSVAGSRLNFDEIAPFLKNYEGHL
jgi:hypothetical protein